jgi:hypothetical protein
MVPPLLGQILLPVASALVIGWFMLASQRVTLIDLLALAAITATLWTVLATPLRMVPRLMDFDGPLALSIDEYGVTISGPNSMRRYAGRAIRVVRFDGWTLLQARGFNPDVVPPRVASYRQLHDAVRRADLAPLPGEPPLDFRVRTVATPRQWLGMLASVGNLRIVAGLVVMVAGYVHVGVDDGPNLLDAPLVVIPFFVVMFAVAAPVAWLTGIARHVPEMHVGFDDAGTHVGCAGYVERLQWAACTFFAIDRTTDVITLRIPPSCAQVVEPVAPGAEPLQARAYVARHAPAALMVGDGSDPLRVRLVPRGTLAVVVLLFAFGTILHAYGLSGTEGEQARRSLDHAQSMLAIGVVAGLVMPLVVSLLARTTSSLDPIGRRARG